MKTVNGYAALVVATTIVILAAGCDAPEQKQESTEPEGAVSKDEVPRMVELYSPYCPVCASMKPVVEEVVSRCDKKGVRVDTVDISRDGNEGLMDHYRVKAVPTFLFLDEYGVEVARLVGAQSEQTLKQALSVLGGEACPGMSFVNDEGDLMIGG